MRRAMPEEENKPEEETSIVQDEAPPRAEPEQPGVPPEAFAQERPPPQCPEPEPETETGTQAETPTQALADTALMDLASRFGQVEEQLADFHRRSAHRESVIDMLHEENQQLRAGMSRAILEPVVADLIRLYDQIDREARRVKAEGRDERLLSSFADDVAQILDRCGIDIYTAEPGDPFDRQRHRPLAVVACPDQARHNTVAEMASAGFAERETGRVRRPVQARFYQYTAAGEPSRDGAAQSQAQSQAQSHAQQQ
jgi:molecular chaperone GrpE (heat shock protein)